MATMPHISELHPPQNWLRAVLAGIEAALLVWLLAVVGALVTYVTTASAPGLGTTSWSSTVGVATRWWTLAFGGRVAVDDAVVSLAPLGLTLLSVVLLRGALRRMGVDTIPAGAFAAAAFTATVALVGVMGGVGVGVHVLGALVAGALGCTAALWGRTSLVARAVERWPGWGGPTRDGLAAAGHAIVWALGLGVALVVVAVATSWDQVREIHDALRPDLASAIVLTVAQLLYLPNFAVWALGWVSGPGFAVGAGTHFSAFGSTTEPLPAIPALGALPDPGTTMGWLIALPVLLGLALGLWRGAAPARRPSRWRDLARHVAAFTAATFAGLSLLGTVATGSIGPGRMAVVGVDGPVVAAAVTGLLLAGYAVVLLLRLPVVAGWLRSGVATVREATVSSFGFGTPREVDDTVTSVPDDDALPLTDAAPAPATDPTATDPTAAIDPTAATAVTSPTAASAAGAGPGRTLLVEDPRR